ncbi:urotensin-2-like isoform X1 [Sceloporus undulatus]|uniref:urotensin-2-like isoform X1 n=1 Tax=Sceloporus undulatus TaxID=8520 RepID=UPI001C4D7A39|nr:urotensin-2-like isoform X1 [Sceloporus undulatus]
MQVGRMEKLGWICLSLASLTGPVCGTLSPVAMTRDLTSWPPAPDGEDARLGLEELNSQNRGVLRQSLAALLGLEEDDDPPSKTGETRRPLGHLSLPSQSSWASLFILPAPASPPLACLLSPKEPLDHLSASLPGLRPDSFQPESVKKVLLAGLPRAMLLSRLLANNRKQYKKRGNLSECFWKYCV